MNAGGLYKRMGPGPIMNFVRVEDIVQQILERVERPGGKIIMPKTEIPSVWLVAVIQDTEGDIIGLWNSVSVDIGNLNAREQNQEGGDSLGCPWNVTGRRDIFL